jgi:hypothetical protein
MRTTFLSRSIIAAAAFAAGSAALASVPATASTPSGITREMVLTAADGIRAAYSSGDEPSTATIKAVRAIVNRACNVDADGGEFVDNNSLTGLPVQAGGSADGLAAGGQIVNILTDTARSCIVGVVTSTTPGYDLSGTATLSATSSPGNQVRTVTAPLSGDVAATAPLLAGGGGFSGMATFSATGAASRTVVVPAKTVKDKKTKAEKKAAKKKYAKRLQAAKKAYAKALERAGGSTTKRAAAKKAYSAARQSAKAKYRYATADYRIVKKATTTTDSRPFSLALLTL